jgi:heme-degrading monooxygenase HmoA
MTVVTVFRSRLRDGVDAAYALVATDMSRLVRQVEGFVDERFYLGDDGERVTIVRFRDLDAQRAWAEHPAHVTCRAHVSTAVADDDALRTHHWRDPARVVSVISGCSHAESPEA